MDYQNSPPDVQQQMDWILWAIHTFTRDYVNNIIIFSKTLDEHVSHLHQVFQLFQDLGISLEPKKSYLGYPTVTLLGQWIDALGLTTASEKIKVISDLQFPLTLKALETYLGLTGWVRSYIPYYAQVTAPLQARKMALAKAAPTKGTARKQHTSRVLLNYLAWPPGCTTQWAVQVFRPALGAL